MVVGLARHPERRTVGSAWSATVCTVARYGAGLVVREASRFQGTLWGCRRTGIRDATTLGRGCAILAVE